MEFDEFKQSSVGFYEELIKSIAQPEPMCLMIIRYKVIDYKTLEPITPPMKENLPIAIKTALKERLNEQLRKYDLISEIDSNMFVVALKTLVSENELHDRIQYLKTVIQQPYLFQEVEATIEAEIGYAIRVPGEKPSSLLKRADSKYNRLISQNNYPLPNHNN